METIPALIFPEMELQKEVEFEMLENIIQELIPPLDEQDLKEEIILLLEVQLEIGDRESPAMPPL